jgi:hypothetical protein
VARDPRSDETGWQSRRTETGIRSARAERRRTDKLIEDSREVWIDCPLCWGAGRILVRATLVINDDVQHGWAWATCAQCNGKRRVTG